MHSVNILFITFVLSSSHQSLAAPPFVPSPFDAIPDVGAPYEKDKVVRISPQKHEETIFLQHLRNSLNLDFWTEPIPGHLLPITVRVPGDVIGMFERNLTQQGIAMKHTNMNIAEQVRREFASNPYNHYEHAISKRTASLTSNWTRPTEGPIVVGAFASYASICNWMEEMCRRHPSVATCIDIGKTFEKRNLKLIKIGFPGVNKKGIFMDANIHAREWVSGAAAVWLINKFLTSYRTDGHVFDILSKVDFYILPIANPDGYEYSRLPAQRYWRKTRSRTTKLACFGADPNRNFGFQWGTNGASTNPCAEVFQGSAPFSEPETKAIAEFVHARRRDMLAYFAVHSYGNYWLVPWGFSGVSKPHDFDEMMRVARLGMTAIIAKAGQSWKCGNTVDLLYPAAGGSDDWAKSEGIKYSYTLELRPSSDDPQFGFVVESNQIEPAGIDLWMGVSTSVRAMLSPPPSNRLRAMRYQVRRLPTILLS